MALCFVALLTQKGSSRLQKGRLSRAVGLVAVAAIFRDRLMFPEERPTVFGVETRAGLVDRAFDETCGRSRAMRRMARCASHLAFMQRVMRRPYQAQMLCLVTRPTDFRLRGDPAYGVLGGMQLMAIGAGDLVRRVYAGSPVVRSITLVTAEAHRVLPDGWGMRLSPEIHDAGRLSTLCFDVRAAWSVTRLAL